LGAAGEPPAMGQEPGLFIHAAGVHRPCVGIFCYGRGFRYSSENRMIRGGGWR